MKQRLIIALIGIAVLALAVLTWRLTRGGDDSDADPSTSRATPAETRPQPPKPQRAAREAPTPASVTMDDDPAGPLLLEGLVLDAADAPVAGVTVTLNSNPARTATTDEAGSFQFDKLVPRRYRLIAYVEELVGGPVIHELTESSEPVVIRVVQGASLAVTVVAPDAAPVAGAAVEFRESGVRSATTGADGVARFRGIHGGFGVVVARAPGYGPVAQPVQIPDSPGATAEVRLILTPGAPVAGKVVDEAGAPVKGARVVARESAAWLPLTNPRLDGVVTDDRGGFRIPALAAGSYRLVATHPDHAPATSEPLSLDGATERTDIVIVARAGGVLAGTVVDGAGAPVPFATVRVGASLRGVTGPIGGNDVRQSVADDRGLFRVAGLPRSEVKALALTDEASSEPVTANLAEVAEKTGVELRLVVSGTIAGRVVDAAKEPVAEVQVTVIPDFLGGGPVDDFALRGVAAATTDGDGRFSVGGLVEGAYRLRPSRAGASQRQWMQPGVVASTGDTDVELVLEDNGGVKGTLQFDDGTAPEMFTVAVGFPPGVPVADPRGAFSLPDIAPGTYDVRFRGAGFAQRVVRDVTVRPGETADLGTIEIHRGRDVAGRVVDRNGSPVAEALVVAATRLLSDGKSLGANLGQGTDEQMGVRRATTADDGSFRITGIGDRNTLLVAEHPDVGRSLPTPVPRGPTAPYELVLMPFGSVAGLVTAAGKPASAMVTATPKTSPNQSIMVQTGPDGRYVIERIPEGTHRLTALLQAGVFGANSSGKDVVIQGGQQATADIDIEIGEIEVLVGVTGIDGAKIDAAQVFLFRGQVSVSNAAQVQEVFLEQNNAGGAMAGFAMAGQPARFAQVVPAQSSVCVLPINGDMNDPTFIQRLQEHSDQLAVYCEPKTIAESPNSQRFDMVVPPMKPLPTGDDG